MKELVKYGVPTVFDDFDVSFVGSMVLDNLENGIRELSRATDLLALVQGVAIVKVEQEKLWMQAGFPNLRAYRIAQAERLDMPRTTISLRRQTAEGYLAYQKELAGVDLNRKVSYLQYLSAAVERHGTKKAVEALQSMTFREFAAWASPAALEEPGLEDVEFSFRKGDIVIEGRTVGKLSEEIPPEEKDFIAYLLRSGYKARKGGASPYVVPVRSDEERKAVDGVIKKLRKG